MSEHAIFRAHLTCQGAIIYPNNKNIETPATKVPKSLFSASYYFFYHPLKKQILNLDDLLLCAITTHKKDNGKQ
jgi:hypothetical protein